MSDVQDQPTTPPAKRNHWQLALVLSGLAALLYLIITFLPLAVNDEHREFLADVDRLMADRQYALAQQRLEHQITQNTATTEYLLRLGICHSMQEHFDQARQTFDQALADDPQEPRLLYNRALLDYRQRRYDPAMDRLAELAELAPYFPGVRYHMARIHEIQDHPRQALSCYVQELNLDPASSSTWRRYLYLRRELALDQAGP
jgi:tetratricopeptide (TPR) repeat protein